MTESEDSTRDAARNLLDPILSVDAAVFGKELASLDDPTFHLLSQRFKVWNDIVQNEEDCRIAIHQEGSNPIPIPIPIPNKPSSSSNIDHYETALPPEALRQVMRSGFLTVPELGRLLLLTCKSFVQVLGHEHVYRHLCHTQWPNTDSVPTSLIEARGYQWLFYHRLGRINLQPKEGELSPLAPPTISSRDLQFYISISNGSKEIISEAILSPEQIHEMLTQATVTMDLQHPIPVTSLPLNRCHCWNLPGTDAYQDWRATVHLLHLGNSHHAAQNSSCHCLLDTGFCLWRGWSQVGELVFLQRERIRGLELTDRGKYLEHRIVRTSNTSSTSTTTTRRRDMSNWQGYLGLQFKMTLMCSVAAGTSTSNVDADVDVDGDVDEQPAAVKVPFEFQKLKLEAIRVHENSHGNIQHHLFRKDMGWQRHGVELAHLLEELVE
jgi:hypothetical protein